MPEDILDVLIVGAGLAGSTAAHTLLQQDPSVSLHLVEADSVVGGRTRNWQSGDHAVELGATWASPNHTALLDLCDDLGISVYRANPGAAKGAVDVPKQNGKIEDMDMYKKYLPWWYWGTHYHGKSIFHSSSGKFTFESPESFYESLDPGLVSELQQVGDFIWDVSDTLSNPCWDANEPGEKWSQWDIYSTGAALFPKLHTKESRNILRHLIHSDNCNEPSTVGFLCTVLGYSDGCESVGPETYYRIRGGSQAVAQAVADNLGSDRLTLGDGVLSIEADPTRNSQSLREDMFHVTLHSGRTFRTKVVIVTGSPPAIMNIRFNPPWPSVDTHLLQNMPMGTARRFLAIYEKPWWREDFDLSGSVLVAALPPHLCVPDSADDQPVFDTCTDFTPYSQSQGVLACFVRGDSNLYFSTLSAEQQEQMILEFLEHTFADLIHPEYHGRNSSFPLWKPDNIFQYDWTDNPNVRGAFTAHISSGIVSVPSSWKAMLNLEKLPNLWLAGSDYEMGYGGGFMEGAVRSGKQVATLVQGRLQQLKKTSVVKTH